VVPELFTNAGMTVSNTYDSAQTPASCACEFYDGGSTTGLMNVGVHPTSGQGAFLAYTVYPLSATEATCGNVMVRDVPEPGTTVPLGLGMLGLGIRWPV